ncbi:hypothetical protein [Methylobacterium sp. J-068]|uniref:hypothetical protein n=1 Tax=Methylobacterium sp. J-068 TaxID=2836649 RepID=UPI001FB88FFF|nr:hypothetical protein [Methylobacterium sp. J-068]MCJ2032782.1 hypothetical protein [Methylobacterium sp. J-068]
MRRFGFLLVLISVLGAAGWSGAAYAAPSVQVIYLVPADRSVSESYRKAAEFGVRHVQAWLNDTLKGATFRLADPLVRVVRSDRKAAWFRSTDRHAGYGAFYRNAVDELTRLGLARYDDPSARYLVYVDADHACGQSGAGGNGIAVVSANDLRGLAGEPIVPACGKANGAEIPGRCRWIGGIGHELLHTIGLIHPDRSPACQTAQCRAEALMMQGYVTYPRATLLDEEKAQIRRSPFIEPGIRTEARACANDAAPPGR